MPLREHLRELRSRLLKAGIAIALGAVAGWFLYDPLIEALKAPVDAMAKERGSVGGLNFGGVSSPFNLKVKLSVYLGIAVASPV
jgi:sec-independent protein translocase protein TatC